MLKATLSFLFLIIIKIIPIYVSGCLSLDCLSYDTAYRELITTPATELDLRITKLNSLLNDENTGIVRHFGYNFSSSENTFGLGWGYISKAACYRDQSRPKIIVCEVFFGSRKYMNIYEKVKTIEFFHQEILDKAKLIIHPSFGQANLKVIFKTISTSMIELSAKEAMDLNYKEGKWSSMAPSNSLSYNTEEKILVICENGIPHYQDAFFAE